METGHIEEKHTFAFENQRWIPLFGWTSVLLPTDVYNFSNDDGTKELNKSDYIDNNNSWEYAVNFQSSFDPICGILSCVRRKKWDIKCLLPNDIIDVVTKDNEPSCTTNDISDVKPIQNQSKRKKHNRNKKINKK